MDTVDSTPNVPFFKKKGKSRPGAARQRSQSPSSSHNAVISEPSTSTVVLPTKKVNSNLLSAGTKRSLTERERDAQDLDLEASNDNGPDVKWSSSNSHITRALEIIAGDEVEELLSKRQKHDPDDGIDEVPGDGQYHGQKAYKDHIVKNKEIPKAMRVGPQRSTNTIRTVTIVDYQPDVCKDYKETGYCGFGDTCKFLHDRGTYLAGWQLDKLAETPRKQPGEPSDNSDSDDEDIPFACLICRKHYTDPVVTRCGHYFCSACAIKRFAKTPKCAACSAPTAGIFNRADKVIEKLNKKQKDKEKDDEDGDGGEGDVEIEGLQEGKNESSEDDENDDEND